MNLTRLARNASAAVVASIAAWSSYQHMVHVALHVGERPDVAYVLPLSVDGMLVVASVAMVDDRRAGRSVRWSAKVAFAVGVLASVGANVAAAQPTIGARIVAAWPALALLLTVELLSRAGRELKRRAAEIEAVAPAVDEPVAPTVPTLTGPVVPAQPTNGARISAQRAPVVARAMKAADPTVTAAEIGVAIGRAESTVRGYLGGQQPAEPTRQPLGFQATEA